MDFLFLLWLHFLGDFPLQGEFISTTKGNNWYIMLTHCAIWTGCICVGLHFIDKLSYGRIVFLFLSHLVTDCGKCNLKDKSQALTFDLHLDQTIHMLQLMAVYFW